jgi:DNA-binding IclR family transcriptional regulator
MIYGESAKRASLSPSRVGNRTYLHRTAGGKAVLAHLPEERVASIVDEYGLPSASPTTIDDESTLRSELASIRERGHAFNEEEFGRGFHGVGVPLFDESEDALGAISVSGPKRNLQGEYFREELPNVLKQTANQIEFNYIYDVQS